MGTSWNGQISHKEKDFRIQFQTDDYEKYKQVEKLCQELMDGSLAIKQPPASWYNEGLTDNSFIPEPCRSCPNHPSNGGSGFCNCTLGQIPITCTSGYINTNTTEDLPTVIVTNTNASTETIHINSNGLVMDSTK